MAVGLAAGPAAELGVAQTVALAAGTAAAPAASPAAAPAGGGIGSSTGGGTGSTGGGLGDSCTDSGTGGVDGGTGGQVAGHKTGQGAGKGYFTDYPKQVGFILSNEFCERFSFYGMKSILVIFLTRALNYSEDGGTAIYHGFNMACYFTPLFGALLADGFLGHYKTIFSISIIYATGNVIMALGAVPFNGDDYIRAIPFVGLILIAIGTGGIKPCVSAFGANQFQDHQVRQKQAFFSMFYMAINVGSLISMVITPLIRSNVRCFNDECYALAFGIPAALMFVAVGLFIAGTKWYRIIPPGENIIGKLFGCIGTALKGKCGCSGNKEKRDHWLDYSDSKYEKKFIDDVKSVMRVLFMFIPLPMFYALFDQQGSRWILQAGKLDGDFGGFVLQPDLIPVINPILVVCLVPVMESCFFPCLHKLNIPNRPLQRLGFGMFLAGTAFIVSGFLQIAIDNSLPSTIPANNARFKILNAAPCDVSVNVTDLPKVFDIKQLGGSLQQPSFTDITERNYTFTVKYTNCKGSPNTPTDLTKTFPMEKSTIYNMVTYWDRDMVGAEGQLSQVVQPLQSRTGNGESRIQFLNTWDGLFQEITVEAVDGVINATRLEMTSSHDVPHQMLKVTVDDVTKEIESKSGAVYTMVLQYDSTDPTEKGVITQFEDISPNSVSILYMFPQYLVMTLGEIFFSITGLSFAYSQAPLSMKAVLQASWLLNNSIGNLLVMVIAAMGSLGNQMAEFFMFAGLMYATVIIFSIMSLTYEYVDIAPVEEDGKEIYPDTKGADNYGMDTDEMPPKYDTVMTGDGDDMSSTHM